MMTFTQFLRDQISVLIITCETALMIMILAKEKPDKTFAFAYLKIMKEDGSIVHDGSHELYVYKV